MELRHLRYFVTVAETENVSRAAQRLHVSQPALSRQIRDVEDELGFALLERTAKSVRLTEAGRVFLVEARAVLQRTEEAVKAARAVADGGQGELHVGYAPTLTARILPTALRTFQTAAPGVRVKLHDLSSEEMLSRLREWQIQVAFLVRPTNAVLRRWRFEEVLRDPLHLAVAAKHRLARRKHVSLAETAREPFVVYSRKDYPEYHQMLSGQFSRVKSRPRIVEEHDGVSSLISAVEAGNGVALVPESISCLAGVRLKLVPLSPAPPPLIIGAVLPKAKAASTAEIFVRCAKEASAGA